MCFRICFIIIGAKQSPITTEQLEKKYPAVADIQAISTSDYNYDEITHLFAEQLIKRLKEQRA